MSDELLSEFCEMYRKHFGIKLEEPEAMELANKLLVMADTLYMYEENIQ